MLEFFRRYQKAFFIFVTAIIIGSFTFFGTFSTFVDGKEEVPDRVIGKAIDGSDLKLLELRTLSRFLASDREDLWQPNLLNDGVIRHDLLATKVAESLVARNLPWFKEGFSQTLHRVKVFKPYEHPEANFLSAKAVWERAAPVVNRAWSELKTAQEPSRELFAHLVSLYQVQGAISPEWLRRVLLLQEQQYNWIHPDPRLRQDDLSMFGFHSLSDWFGAEFVDAMAQVVHNGAIWAAQRGYEATLAEAKADLHRVFNDSVQRRGLEKVSFRDALRVLGMDEEQAAGVWKKVLSFRRCFNDLGKSAFVDRLPYEEFARIAGETASVDIYSWPLAVEIQTPADALQLDAYLDAVCVHKDKNGLPTEFLPVEKVPAELIATRYTARVFAVDKREAALQAPLKELWDFETSDKGWKQLRKEFSVLGALSSVEERFESLEGLDPKTRGKIDLFARRLLIDEHPEWLQEALRTAKAEEKQLVLSAGKIHLDHVQDAKRLGSLFEQILTSPEKALAELSCFQSGDACFRFENIAKTSEPVIKTFVEAKRDGSLDLKKREGKGHFTADRFVALSNTAKKHLEKWVAAPDESPLMAQLKLHRAEAEISRTTAEEWQVQEAFSLQPNQWSDAHITPDGSVAFLHVKERKISEQPVSDSLHFGHEALASDVQRACAERLFDEMKTLIRFKE